MSAPSTSSLSSLIDVTIQDVLEAEERIRPFIYKTPLLTKTALSEMSGFKKGLYFKCESLQRTGSFKIRGGQNAVRKFLEQQKRTESQVSDDDDRKKKKGFVFVCHSSGNAAQAVARAARMNGQKSHIVVPRTAPAAKVDAMRENGAEITFCEPTLAAREAGVKHLVDVTYAKDRNAVFVHPYDDPHVIAGQGTCGLEIAEQFPIALHERNKSDPFLLLPSSSAHCVTPIFITPVGGGGLTSGVSIALRYKFPNALIIGAEPLEADDAARSFESGKIEPLRQVPPPTMADGLMTPVTPRTLAIIRKNVDAIITVTEEEIARATKEIFQRLKIVIEPSAGVSSAVALYKRDEIVRRFPDRNPEHLSAAVCILCGGNVDLAKLGQTVAKLLKIEI